MRPALEPPDPTGPVLFLVAVHSVHALLQATLQPGRAVAAFSCALAAVRFSLALLEEVSRAEWPTTLMAHELCDELPAWLPYSRPPSGLTAASSHSRVPASRSFNKQAAFTGGGGGSSGQITVNTQQLVDPNCNGAAPFGSSSSGDLGLMAAAHGRHRTPTAALGEASHVAGLAAQPQPLYEIAGAGTSVPLELQAAGEELAEAVQDCCGPQVRTKSLGCTACLPACQSWSVAMHSLGQRP